MTVNGAIAMADSMKPNMMTTSTKIAFLNEIDGMIQKELIMTHAHTAEEEEWEPYDAEDGSTELIIPSPYDMLYPYWLMSKIDLLNQELDKYNNDRALFENAYQQAADWINRTRRPNRIVTEVQI